MRGIEGGCLIDLMVNRSFFVMVKTYEAMGFLGQETG